MAFNTDQTKFLDSFQHSISTVEWQPYVIGAIVGFLTLIIGGALFISWSFNHRYSILREFYYWVKKFNPRAENSPRRYEAHYPITLLFSNTHQASDRAQTLDLSPDGMFIKLINPFPVDTSFEFVLRLGQDHTIKGMALVRWSQKSWSEHHPAGMGCEFIDLRDQDKQIIREYLRKTRAPRFTTQPSIKIR